MNNNQGMPFFQGLVVGAAIGAVAGLLLAPKSGAETREDLKEAAKKMQMKAQSVYDESRATLDRKIAALKKAGKKIDTKKYSELVDNVVAEMKDTKNLTETEGKNLGEQLKSDSANVLAALKA